MLQLTAVIPEIFVAFSSMILLVVGAFQKENVTSFLIKAGILILALAAWQVTHFEAVSYDKPIIALNDLFILDGFAIFMKVVVLSAAVFIMILSFEISEVNEKMPMEFPILVLLSVSGMMAMVSANDLMSLYMGLELQSLSLYVMTALNRDSEKSSEAGLKYFILGALASGLLLYGSSLIYGFTGTTNFSDLARIYESEENLSLGVLFGIILVITGLCFKVSAVPFHMWTPDVYEGATKIITAFFASAPKVAAIALFTRFILQAFEGLYMDWRQVIIFVSIASMIVGSFGALRQTNIKRLMAYSSIGHIGFALVGLSAGALGVESVVVYITIYVVMNIGTFGCIMLMRKNGKDVEEIRDLSGIAVDRPLFAALIAVLMLSMAGIPPLAGFIGKFFVFKAALQANLISLAVIGVLASVVSAFYYIRIVKIMYFDKAQGQLDEEMRLGTKFVLIVSGLFNLLLFISPSPLLDAAKAAANTLFL